MRPIRLFLAITALTLLTIGNDAMAQTKLSSKQLYSQFQKPDTRYRPFVRWWWNGDRVNAEELIRELHIMKEVWKSIPLSSPPETTLWTPNH